MQSRMAICRLHALTPAETYEAKCMLRVLRGERGTLGEELMGERRVGLGSGQEVRSKRCNRERRWGHGAKAQQPN